MENEFFDSICSIPNTKLPDDCNHGLIHSDGSGKCFNCGMIVAPNGCLSRIFYKKLYEIIEGNQNGQT